MSRDATATEEMLAKGAVKTEEDSTPPAMEGVSREPIYSCPKGWRELMAPNPEGMSYARPDGLLVMKSILEHPDPDRTWMHVSVSRRTRMPTYRDMTEVKRLFVGEEREAYEVHPPKSKHVNIHPFCRHLWCALEGPALPDFTTVLEMIGNTGAAPAFIRKALGDKRTFRAI